MLPRRVPAGRAGRLDLESEVSRPATFLLMFLVMVMVPLGSYFYLHKSLSDKYVRLEKHMIVEMKEVTRLKQEVAGLSRIKDSLMLSSSALKAALRSFGRPLPEGLHIEMGPSSGTHSGDLKVGSMPSLGSTGTTAELSAGQQGYIFVPKAATIMDCTPDASIGADTMPAAYSLFFKERRMPGMYVEVGAGDGVYQSKTAYLEKALCWTGILVEPTNNEFPRLLVERSRSIAVHGAVCATDGTAPDEFLDVTLNGVWTGWSGFTTMFSNSHHAAIQSKTAPGNTEGWESHKLSVVCFKLSTLLARQQVTHVDYMAVSAQGGELQVLQAMDHNSVSVDVLEVDVSSDTAALKSFLESVGYRYHSQHGIRAHIFTKVGATSPRGDTPRLS